MHVYHIRTKNDVGKIEQINKHMDSGKHVFVLVYMEGCGPCNATRPEWNKLEGALKSQYANNPNLVVVDINKEFLSQLKDIGQIIGFPTMKHITTANGNKKITTFENSPIKRKDRSTDSFIHWIETMMDVNVATTPTTSPQHVFDRISNGSPKKINKHNKTNKANKANKANNMKGGKWSQKYKKSINCRQPQGFSQRQHCKYGQKNTNK